MASVQIFPGLTVTIATTDAQGSITPMISTLIIETQDTIHHSLGVRDRARLVVQFLFDLYLLDASQAEFVEFAVRIDGFNVAHGHIPVADIRAAGGVFNLLSIPDGTTGTVKTAEFRALATSTSADGEDPHTLLRAQQVGQIQVDVRHEWGTPVTDRSGSLHTLRHDGSYSSGIRDSTRATYYVHYHNPSPHDSLMVAFVHKARFGRTGHFVFLYNGEEFVARLNRQPRTGTPAAFSVHSILPDRMSTGHLTRGAMSIIPPDLHHGDIGISVTPHTADAQSTAPTSTAQRSSINVGGGLFATPTESSHSRLDYHDSVASHTAGAQLTASTPTSQQPSTNTGGGSSATPSNNPTTATHSLLRGFVPPTASAPYTSSTQPLGGHPASDFDASGRTSSNDWTSNNPCPAIRPSPQPADTHPNDRPSSANRTTKPNQTARKAPSQAEASNDSAEARASSSSAAPEWGTHLRETILAEAAPFRFPLPTPATGGGPPPFSSLARLRTALAPAGAGNSPSLATREAQGMTGYIRPPDSRPPHGSRPRLSTGSGQDGLRDSQSRNAAAHGAHRTSGLRHSLLTQATSGSDGADTSARSATPQADTMGGPAGSQLLPPYQWHPAAPVTAGGGGPPRSATLQTQPTIPLAPAGADMTDFARYGSFGLPASPRPRLTTQSAQDGCRAPQPNDSTAAALRRIDADLKELMKTRRTTGSGGADNAARPVTSQTQSTAASTSGRGASSLSVTSQAQPMTTSAGPGSSLDTAIVIDDQVASTPATGSGSAPTLPGNLQATSLIASTGPGSPSVSVNPQAESTPATGGGGIPSSLVVPSAESVAGSGSGGPPRKKRKLSAKDSEGSERHTKK